jgi:hypothetical protein
VVDNAPHIPKVEMSHTLIMKMTKNDGWKLANGNSWVVNHLPHNPKVEGLSTTTLW